MRHLPFSGLDVLVVFGTAMGMVGFYAIWPPLAPLFLTAVCFVLVFVGWRATP